MHLCVFTWLQCIGLELYSCSPVSVTILAQSSFPFTCLTLLTPVTSFSLFQTSILIWGKLLVCTSVSVFVCLCLGDGRQTHTCICASCEDPSTCGLGSLQQTLPDDFLQFGLQVKICLAALHSDE